MRFALLNSSSASADDMLRIADGLTAGLVRFCADHGLATAMVQSFPGMTAAPDPSWIPVKAVGDLPAGISGVQAFHDVDDLGVPYALASLNLVPNRTVLHDTSGKGESLAALIGHEIVETLVDFDANRERDVTFVDPTLGTVMSQVAEEVSDAVQESAIPITLPGGLVVDFPNYVYPSWFQARGRATKFDALGLLTKPLSIAPGGYVIARPAGAGVAGDTDVMGRRHLVKVHHRQRQAPWRELAKAHAGSRGRRRGIG